MKVLIFIVALGVSYVFGDPVSARGLTLSDAQSLAVRNSSQVNVLELEVSEARARLNAVRYQNRPSVGVAGGGQFEGTTSDKDLRPLAYAYAGVNLYNGELTKIQESVAQIQVDKAQIGIPAKEFQLRKNIEELFAEIEKRNRMISVKQKELKAFDIHRRKANARKVAGLTGETDVLEFDLRKSSLSNDIETIKAEINAYFKVLSLLTGESSIDSIEGYRLPEQLKMPDLSTPGLSGVSSVSRILSKELSGIPLEEKLQSAKWGPRVDLEGRAGLLPKEGEIDDNGARFDVMIVAKLDLFNNQQRNAELQETVARKKKLEAMIKAEDIDTRLLVDQGLTALQSQLKKFQILEKSRPSAERYYRSTLGEYERGIKNSPDVAHATEMLFDSEYKSIEFRYNWAMQKIKLETVLMREI
jgi:outer membrane protein TolC